MRLTKSCVLWYLVVVLRVRQFNEHQTWVWSVPQEGTTWMALWRHIPGLATQPLSLLSFPPALTPSAIVDSLLRMLI